MGRLSEEISNGPAQPYASREAAIKLAELAERKQVQFFINQTDLLAGTAQELIAPCDGYIVGLYTTVQAAVTTGGDITVEASNAAVTGLSVTIGDAAAAGSRVSDTIAYGVASAKVKKGDRIEVVPAAAFATAGAVNGFVEILADAAG